MTTLEAARQGAAHSDMAADRKSQVGSGMRADKIITIQFQNDMARHHITGKKISAKKFMKGHMDQLWI